MGFPPFAIPAPNAWAAPLHKGRILPRGLKAGIQKGVFGVDPQIL